MIVSAMVRRLDISNVYLRLARNQFFISSYNVSADFLERYNQLLKMQVRS